jgi:hypothetical protein
VHQDRGAAPAAVAHQQVRPESDEKERLLRRQLPQESREVVEVRGPVEALRRAAGAPRHVAPHRLVAPEFAAQVLEGRRLGHVHAA